MDPSIDIDTKTAKISTVVSYYKTSRFPYHFDGYRLNRVVEYFI